MSGICPFIHSYQSLGSSQDASQLEQLSTITGSDIRVVRFKPSSSSSNNDRIEGKLLHIPIDGSDFHALSYVWGAPGDTFTISLDGTDFQVTSNLFAAIKQLRDRPDLTREANSLDDPALTGTDARQPATAWEFHCVNYWIDAICIDQSNVKEKNIQVIRMKQLYSTATKVVIWLGDPSDLRPDLNEQSITTALAAGDDAFKSICEAGHNSVTMFGVSAATRLKILTDVMEDPSQLVESMVDIIVLSLKWNSRIWTLQEAVLARDDPIVIVGKNVTTLLKLAWLQYCLSAVLNARGPLERHVPHPYEHVIHVLDFRALALYAGHLSIRDQLSRKPPQNRGDRFRCLATNFIR